MEQTLHSSFGEEAFKPSDKITVIDICHRFRSRHSPNVLEAHKCPEYLLTVQCPKGEQNLGDASALSSGPSASRWKSLTFVCNLERLEAMIRVAKENPECSTYVAETAQFDVNKLIRDARQAWEEIRTRLTTAPILAYPGFPKASKSYIYGSKEWGSRSIRHSKFMIKSQILAPDSFLPLPGEAMSISIYEETRLEVTFSREEDELAITEDADYSFWYGPKG
ncbi:hypothetical protein IFM47457_08204 [Aspergillus lentulus]|nr:hypothetical protein IFM47457_08204 [Aspergillus lentulus]